MAVNAFHVEAWSLPLESTTKTVGRVPFIRGSFKDPLSSQSGQGSLTVQSSWDRLSDVTDPENDVGSLMVIFQDNAYYGAFYGTRTAESITDKGDSLTTISGRHIQNALQTARLENFDYPDRPTIDPDWNWGAGASVNGFRNGGFEESEEIPDQPSDDVANDFEDQSLQGWLATRDFLPDFEENDATVKVNSTDAQAGTYSMEVNSGVAMSGFRKLVRVIGGVTNTFQWYMKSVTTGEQLNGMIDLAGGTTNHTNAYTINDRGWCELGNVAKDTGTTDALWQLMQLSVTYPTFSSDEDLNFKDVWIYAVFNDAGNGPLIRLDTFAAGGPGIGLLPWKRTDAALVTVFEQDATHTDPDDTASTVSAKVTTTAANEGINQKVEGLTAGRTYTFRGKVYHETGSNQSFRLRMRRGSGDGQIAANTDSIITGTTDADFTYISVTGEVDQDTIVFDVTKDTAGTFWLDSFEVIEGLDVASWGDIQIQLLDDLTVDHTAEAGRFALNAFGSLTPVTWLDYSSFTALLDSGGDAWDPATVAYRAKAGKKMSQVATDGVRFGHEYLLTFDPTTPEVVLGWFNPYDWTARTGGVGTNKVGTGVRELSYGSGVTSGPVVKTPGGANRIHVAGDYGRWNVKQDATKVAALGTQMLYEGDPNVLGDDSLTQIADRILDDRTVPATALKVNIDPGPDPGGAIPGRDFTIGDTYPINLPGKFVGAKRVVQITTNFTPSYGTYVVEFDATTFTSDPTKALAEAVRRLLEKFDELDGPVDDSGPTTSIIPVTGTGPIEPSFFIAASNARPELQDVADFVCSGSGDESTVDAAISAMAGTPWGLGRFVFSAGSFSFNTAIDFRNAGSVNVLGMGRESTYFNFQDITALHCVMMADHSSFDRITIQEVSE